MQQRTGRREARPAATRGECSLRRDREERGTAMERVGLMLASAARHRPPHTCTHDARGAVPRPPQARIRPHHRRGT